MLSAPCCSPSHPRTYHVSRRALPGFILARSTFRVPAATRYVLASQLPTHASRYRPRSLLPCRTPRISRPLPPVPRIPEHALYLVRFNLHHCHFPPVASLLFPRPVTLSRSRLRCNPVRSMLPGLFKGVYSLRLSPGSPRAAFPDARTPNPATCCRTLTAPFPVTVPDARTTRPVSLLPIYPAPGCCSSLLRSPFPDARSTFPDASTLLPVP